MAWPSASASEEIVLFIKQTEGRKPMTTEERVTEVEQRAKSNSHRIDEMQTDLKNLTELTASVKVLATKQENVESDVREIKTDVKALTEKPGKRWDAIVAAVVTAIVAGLVGWALAHAGLG
nr:MAG TPA: hemolysin [Caudoviricetes sp.]